MINVIRVERKSEVLSTSSLACLSRTPAVNLTSGCAHGCIYCYARGYSTYAGDGKVVVYQNTLEKIKRELLHKRIKPKEVYFSPSSDLFQPVPEVLELGRAVLEYLLSRGIGVTFLTKGQIPVETMNLILNHADKVRAQIGIITPDESIRQIFEPGAAEIDVRLRQIKRMIDGGISLEARLMPILPGITDTRDSIERLFIALAGVGVKKAAISTLFLRPAIAEFLKRRVPDTQSVDKILDLYNNMERMPVHARNSSVTPLPRARREEIYSRVTRLAREYEVEVSVCGCMNPDIGGSCDIAGKGSLQCAQPSLF